MPHLVKRRMYKPQTLFFEMQQLGQTCICWFSGSYNTYQVQLASYFVFEILGQNFCFKESLPKISSSFYRATSKIHRTTWEKKINLLHTHLGHWIVGNLIGFSKVLRVRGVGYKFEISPLKITASVGYSHFLSKKWPLGSAFRSRLLSKKATQISFQGSDLHNLNLYAATIRNFRRPDVYKGKGLRYQNELVKRKEGKKKKIS